MHILNMKEKDIQKQTEPVFDLYRDNVKDVIDTDINDALPSRNNYLQLLKPSTPAL